MSVHRKDEPDVPRRYNKWPAPCSGCEKPIEAHDDPIIEWHVSAANLEGDCAVVLFHPECALDFGLGFMRDVWEARGRAFTRACRASRTAAGIKNLPESK